MIKLGNRIRELRKAKGLTQEQMASAFSVSPQAVSKWENGGGYPDMGLIPIIANYFDVTLDDLFDFDVNKKSEEIEDILRKVGPYFWNDFDRAEQIFLDGIKKYPGSEKLKTELLSLYECHVRTLDRRDLMDRFEELARRLTLELTDVFAVCSAKNSLISLYMMQDKYAHAKAVADTLPYMYPYILNDRMRCASYLLRGEDRLKEAKVWKVIEEQELFVACVLEGTGYFEIGDYENALKSFTEACDVIELFMIPGKIQRRRIPSTVLIPIICATMLQLPAATKSWAKLQNVKAPSTKYMVCFTKDCWLSLKLRKMTAEPLARRCANTILPNTKILTRKPDKYSILKKAKAATDPVAAFVSKSAIYASKLLLYASLTAIAS